MAGFSST